MAQSGRLLHVVHPREDLVYGMQALSKRRATALFILAGLARRAGWQVQVIDENYGTPPDETPDLVAIAMWTKSAPVAYRMADAYRARGIPVVLGGVHASVLPSEAARHADAVVCGEAEAVLAEVLADAEDGALKQLYHGAWLDMDAVPHASEYVDLYAAEQFRSVEVHTYQTTRGCRFNCEFCSVIRINGRGARHQDPARVVDELQVLLAHSRRIPPTPLLFFLDDDMGSDLEYTASLCEAMIAADLKVSWSVQATTALARDPELLTLAARSGMRSIYIGFESIAREALVEANKKNRPTEYGDLVARLHAHDITVAGGFLFGFDHDRPGVFAETAAFADRIGIDTAQFHILTPFPGTGTFAKLYGEGRIFDTNWAHYDAYHAVFEGDALKPADLRAGIGEAYGRFYAARPQLRRSLRLLRNSTLIGAASNTLVNMRYGRYYRGTPPTSTVPFAADPEDLKQLAATSSAPADEAIAVAVGEARVRLNAPAVGAGGARLPG